MANITKTGTLVRRIALINLASPTSNQITLLISGKHGIGKTAAIRQASQFMRGFELKQDGSMTKDGEILGIPFVSTNLDGQKEIQFVKHKVVSAIARLETRIYEKAKAEGFLNGRVKLDENGNTLYKLRETDKEYTVIPARTEFEDVVRGDDNAFKFGEDLPLELKIELISPFDKSKNPKTPEIPMVFFFFDEMNRADRETLKEFMNIVLARNINGYDLPWWVSMVAAVNPPSDSDDYHVLELDPAQRDRFLIINAVNSPKEFIDYGLENDLSGSLLRFIGEHSDALMTADAKSFSKMSASPSPRSWEQVDTIDQYIYKTNLPGFFTDEEIRAVEDDKLELWAGKVGDTLAQSYAAFKRKASDHIKPEEILNGKTAEISEDVKKRFKAIRTNAVRLITIRDVSKYLVNKHEELREMRVKDKVTFNKYMAQLKDFLTFKNGILSEEEIMVFVKPIINNHVPLLILVGDAFSKEVIGMHAATIAERKIKDN